MRPKLTLLLVLTIGTVMFMAFLVKENKAAKIAKCTCCKKATTPADSGGVDASNGTINHLIVSTIN